MAQQPQLPEELIRKIMECLAISIARKKVAESAKALVIPATE